MAHDRVADERNPIELENVTVDDPDRARELLDQWIENPVLREQGEQMIERAREGVVRLAL